MKLSYSILSIFFILNCFYYTTFSQSTVITSISSIYRGITQNVTLTGTGFSVNTNLTLKNTFSFYGVVIECPKTIYINNNSMSCEIPSAWASDYTSISIFNTYVSRYLSAISTNIDTVSILSSTSIQVTGDALLPIDSTIQLQLYNGRQYNLTCITIEKYKDYTCAIPFDNLLTNCFRINYIDSSSSTYENVYLAPSLLSVELLGNAIKLEADVHCPNNSPTLGLTINSIQFSSSGLQSSGDNLYFYQPTFTLCTDYSKLFNISLTASYFSSSKFNSNQIHFDCSKGKADASDSFSSSDSEIITPCESTTPIPSDRPTIKPSDSTTDSNPSENEAIIIDSSSGSKLIVPSTIFLLIISFL